MTLRNRPDFWIQGLGPSRLPPYRPVKVEVCSLARLCNTTITAVVDLVLINDSHTIVGGILSGAFQTETIHWPAGGGLHNQRPSIKLSSES